MEPKRKPTVIEVSKDNLRVRYSPLYNIEQNGMVSWFIPGFEIFFSTKDYDSGHQRSQVLVSSFVNYFFKQEKSFRNFILHLHKLGFKAPVNHEWTIKQLIGHNMKTAVKLKSNTNLTPKSFENSESMELENELEMSL